MRRAIGVTAACAAVLALGAEVASADVVSKRVVRCEADMIWQLFGTGGATTAELTFDSGAGAQNACRSFHVGVQDDFDPFLVPEDFSAAGTATYRLVGVSSEGLDYTFAGTLVEVGGPTQGPAEIAGGMLNAQLTAMYADGRTSVIVHTGTGSCGSRCFKTHTVWTTVRE